MWPVSARFAEALKSPVHDIRIRMVVLDTDYHPVEGGTFHDLAYTADATGLLVDGSVDLDITRGTRRTFNITLLNPNGEWSPGSNWEGMFYVNRLIRLYRGVQFSETENEMVPIGTFMIDHADVINERNMSLVNLSGSDLWKKLAKSEAERTHSYAAGTSLRSVIANIASRSGVTKTKLSSFPERTTDEKDLNKKLVIEQGDNYGEVLLKLAKDYGFEIYFDPMGYLTTDDLTDSESAVWTFDTTSDPGMLLTAKATYNDDKLFNYVLVIGTGNKDAVVTAIAKDTDPYSPTNLTRLGRRVLKHETDNISTQAAATKAAKRLFQRNMLVAEDIDLEAICNPALEGNDIIRVFENDFTKLNRNYRIRGLTIPLASSRQNIRVGRNISLG